MYTSELKKGFVLLDEVRLIGSLAPVRKRRPSALQCVLEVGACSFESFGRAPLALENVRFIGSFAHLMWHQPSALQCVPQVEACSFQS